MPGSFEKNAQQFGEENAWFVEVRRLVFLPWQCFLLHSPLYAPIFDQKWYSHCASTSPFTWYRSLWCFFNLQNEKEHGRKVFCRHCWSKYKNEEVLSGITKDEFEECLNSVIKDWACVLILMESTFEQD